MTPTSELLYRRVVIKLSGEALSGRQEGGIDPQTLKATAEDLKAVHETGIQVGIVVGGGNIFVATSAPGFLLILKPELGPLSAAGLLTNSTGSLLTGMLASELTFATDFSIDVAALLRLRNVFWESSIIRLGTLTKVETFLSGALN